MPISSLTVLQQKLLAATIQSYILAQGAAGNFLVYNQIRTATTAQIQTALNPLLNTQLTAAQAAQSALAAKQAAETAAVNQLVTDLQAIIAQLA